VSDASEPADSAASADAAGTAGAGAPTVESGQGAGVDVRLPDADRVAQYLLWGALAVLVLFAFVAAVSLYTSVGRIIEVWAAEEFEPVFYAAFNLLAFLLAAAGISVLLRRLR